VAGEGPAGASLPLLPSTSLELPLAVALVALVVVVVVASSPPPSSSSLDDGAPLPPSTAAAPALATGGPALLRAAGGVARSRLTASPSRSTAAHRSVGRKANPPAVRVRAAAKEGIVVGRSAAAAAARATSETREVAGSGMGSLRKKGGRGF
jgi:hypothetical protein